MPAMPTIPKERLRPWLVGSIIGVGISSVTTQILTIREFLTQFHGNEITISLVIFCWLVLTGIGTLAAKPFESASIRGYLILTFLIALWPLVQIPGIRFLRELFFTHGLSPGFYPILFYVVPAIAPYCLLTGFVLPYTQKLFHHFHLPFKSGDLYITDSIGDILGGILFSFLLVYWLKPFAVMVLCASLLLVITLYLMLLFRRWPLLTVALLFSAIFVLAALMPTLEMRTLQGQYGAIAAYVESPFGRIVVSKDGPQYTFWESGTPLYSDDNVIEAEEKVHYPLCQREKADSILLVSGGLGETLSEISKYRPRKVDYVELDPALTQTASELNIIPNVSFLNIINMDARRFIKSTVTRYDAVILDLPEPDTFQINRFFTDEFFLLAKKILKDGGILSLSLPYSSNYLSPLRKKKLSTVYHTVKKHFDHILVLPGEHAYFLMSDQPLSPAIPEKLTKHDISTDYIKGFFHGNITDDRIEELNGQLQPYQTINTDFKPKLMHLVFMDWFTRYGTTPAWFAGIVSGLLLIYLIFMKREEYILFSTGFVAMGLELAVIFAFQIIYGYIYLKIGAIITAFLLGLLPGAVLGNRQRMKTRFSMGLSEAVLMGLLSVFLCWVSWIRLPLHSAFFLIFCFVFSFVCGFQFPVAARMIGEAKSPAAGCLAADLVGAAVGALAVGTLLIPLWGMGAAILCLMMVKGSSMVLMMLQTKN